MPHDQFGSTKRLMQALSKRPPPEPAQHTAARKMLTEAAQGAGRAEAFRNVLEVTTEEEFDDIVRIAGEVDPWLLDAREAPVGDPGPTAVERQAAEQAQADASARADRQALLDAGYEPVWSVPDRRWTPSYADMGEEAADRFDEAWAAGHGLEAAVEAAEAAGS
jgi:hypothetical protein